MGSQIPTILTLGHPLGEMGAQKGVSKKVAIFKKQLERFLEGPAAEAGSLELKNSSKFAEKHALK